MRERSWVRTLLSAAVATVIMVAGQSNGRAAVPTVLKNRKALSRLLCLKKSWGIAADCKVAHRYIRVSKVLPTIGKHRYPLLVVALDTSSIGVNNSPDESVTKKVWKPWIALVTVGKSVSFTAALQLPYEDEHWGNTKWGAAILKDVDGDGSVELTVFYSYYASIMEGFEDVYQQATWVSFSGKTPLRQQFTLVMHKENSANGFPSSTIARRIRYVPSVNGINRDLEVRLAKMDQSCTTVTTHQLTRYIYDKRRDTWKKGKLRSLVPSRCTLGKPICRQLAACKLVKCVCSKVGTALQAKKKYGAALVAHRNGCRLRSAKSCWHYGQLMEKGLGTTNRPKSVLRSYVKACKYKYARACRRAGRGYQQGLTGRKNIRLAKLYYEAGCKLNDTASCALLKQLRLRPSPQPNHNK